MKGQGSYINIWISKGAKAKAESPAVRNGGGFENQGFSSEPRSECNELVSLGFAPIEDRVDELLDKFGITFVIKSESQKRMVNGNEEEVRVMLQVFVPEEDLENILIGLQKCGVGVVAGTGFSLLPTSGQIILIGSLWSFGVCNLGQMLDQV